MHNAFAIDEAIGAPAGGPTRDWADSLVSWLPLHHDMGLVGCLFVAIATGLDLWLLPLPTIDPLVVARSAAGLDSYGPDFRYSHYAGMKRLPSAVGGVAAVTGLVTAFLGLDAVTHILRDPRVVAANEQMGAPVWFPVVCGVVLALCLVAYLVPRTATFGAVLMVGYFGGACAVTLLTGRPLIDCLFAIVTATLVWTGLWPRDARLRRIFAAR